MTETKEWATPYHASVNDFRRELAGESAMFHKRMGPHRDVAFAAMTAKRAGQEHAPLSQAEEDAYIGCLMAGSYAYTLAAVLRVAEQEFGREVVVRLACVADDIITNGDDHDRNADVADVITPSASESEASRA